MKHSLFLLVLFGALPLGSRVEAGLEPRSEWMGAYLNSHKVGWSRLSIGGAGRYPDPLIEAARTAEFVDLMSAGAALVEARSAVEITAYGGVRKLDWTTVAALNPDLSTHRFWFRLEGDDSSIQLTGRVVDSELHLAVQTANSTNEQRLTLPEGKVHLAETIPLLIAQRLQDGASVEEEIPVFEPHQFSLSSWKILLEEIEAWPLDGKGDEKVYRIRQEIGGLNPVLWMNREGVVYKEWAPFSEELGYLSFSETQEQAANREYLNPSLFSDLPPTLTREGRPDLIYAASVPVPERISPSREVARMVVDLWNFQMTTPIPESPWQSNLGRYRNLEPTAELPLRLEILSPDIDSAQFPNSPLDPALLAESHRALLEAEPLVQTDHPDIRRIAGEIVGDLASPWEKAAAIYHWMADNIQTEFRITLPSAVEVLESRKGDCNEQSTLFAALARAAGVPTKICTGLVYQNDGFYYHAWNEVLVSAAPEVWIPIDPALKQIRVDATHIKFGEGGLSEQTYLTGLIGRIRARIVEFDLDDKNRESDQTIRTQNRG